MARTKIHVRGDGPVGAGNGTSYTNAYGWVDFIASGDSSTGGNTYQIYGIVKPYAKTGSPVAAYWDVPAGTAKQPTVVTGDDLTDPCEGIWGGFNVNETFTSQGGGRWSVDLDAANWNTAIVADAFGFTGDLNSANDYTVLDRVDTEVGMPAGSYTWDYPAGILWVRLPDDSDPQNNFWIGGTAGHRVVIQHAANHVVFHKLKIYDTYRSLIRLTSHRVSFIWVNQCVVKYNHTQACPIYYQADEVHFRRCDVSESEQGIYFISQAPTTKAEHAQDCSITKCHVHDIGYSTRWDGSPPDNSCVSWQHPDQCVFSENRGSNAFFLFDGWAGGNQNPDTPFRQMLIERNHFHSPHEQFASTSAGVSVSAASSQWTPAAGDSDGNIVRYNVLDGDMGGDTSDYGVNVGTWPSQVVVEYNMVLNYKRGLNFGVGATPLDMSIAHNYNKYRGITDYFVYHDINNLNDVYVGDFNSYVGTPSGNHFKITSTQRADLAAAQAAGEEGANST